MAMNDANEKLDQLLADGKIGEEDYRRLTEAMRDKEKPGAYAVAPQPEYREQPWQIWPVLIACLLNSVGILPTVHRHPIGLLVIAGNLLLVYGLFKLKGWAFYITIGICFLSIIGIGKAPLGAIINVTLGCILLSGWKQYFGRSGNARSGDPLRQ